MEILIKTEFLPQLNYNESQTLNDEGWLLYGACVRTHLTERRNEERAPIASAVKESCY